MRIVALRTPGVEGDRVAGIVSRELGAAVRFATAKTLAATVAELGGDPWLLLPLDDADEATLIARCRRVKKRATAELEQRLELAISGAELGVWDWNVQTGECYFTPRCAEIRGYEPGELEPTIRMWGAIVHPDDLPNVIRAWLEHMEGKTPFYRTEHRSRAKNGEWKWVFEAGKVVERDATGTPLRATGITLDLTERKRMEQRLLISERMASVGTLAAGVAHEINNPLAFLFANVEFAIEQLRAETTGGTTMLDKRLALVLTDAIDALSEAREGAERVRRIVRDLKTFSRADEDAIEPVDVTAAIESALSMANNQLRHRARLVREFEEVPRVMGNQARLGQVFLNLLINAAQAIPEGRTESNVIRVVVKRSGRTRIVVEIHDTGQGISPEMLPRIFDPFFTTKAIGEGTGLGLAICQNIVTNLGGTITASSDPPNGSVLRVTLPAAPPKIRERVTPSISPRVDKRKRVLVIDDEPMVGTAVRRMLERHHDVIIASSAEEAETRIRDGERFDAVLCDVMMPEVTGIECHARIAALAPEQADRFAFMTGGAFTDFANEFLSRTDAVLVDKPFSRDVLLSAIEKIAAMRSGNN